MDSLVVPVTVPFAVVVVLGVLHWALALALIVALVLLATVPGWLRRRAERQGVRLRAALGELNAEVVDTVQGLREVVSFGAQAQRRQAVAASSLTTPRCPARWSRWRWRSL